MPLTKCQFELGIDDEAEDWMRQVYALLQNNRELVYSSTELDETILGAPVPVAMRDKFRISLDVLVMIRAVEKRWVEDSDYYAFLQDLDTDTSEPDLRSFA